MATTAIKTKVKPKFKIGDRVIMNPNFLSEGKSITGTIIKVVPNMFHRFVYFIETDNKEAEYFNSENEFKLAK